MTDTLQVNFSKRTCTAHVKYPEEPFDTIQFKLCSQIWEFTEADFFEYVVNNCAITRKGAYIVRADSIPEDKRITSKKERRHSTKDCRWLLQTHKVPKNLKEFVDYNYIAKLNEEEKQWLAQFTDAYYTGAANEVSKDWSREQIRDGYNRSNRRRRDTMHHWNKQKTRIAGEDCENQRLPDLNDLSIERDNPLSLYLEAEDKYLKGKED